MEELYHADSQNDRHEASRPPFGMMGELFPDGLSGDGIFESDEMDAVWRWCFRVMHSE